MFGAAGCEKVGRVVESVTDHLLRAVRGGMPELERHPIRVRTMEGRERGGTRVVRLGSRQMLIAQSQGKPLTGGTSREAGMSR